MIQIPIVTDIINAGAGLVKSIFGDREKRDEQGHKEQIAVISAQNSEFSYAANNRTKWDSFIDGINRLPRPAMTFGVMGLLGYAVGDPAGFEIAMTALTLVPEWLQTMFFLVVSFWFGTKVLERASFGPPRQASARPPVRPEPIEESEGKTPEKPEIRTVMRTPAPWPESVSDNAAIEAWKKSRAERGEN